MRVRTLLTMVLASLAALGHAQAQEADSQTSQPEPQPVQAEPIDPMVEAIADFHLFHRKIDSVRQAQIQSDDDLDAIMLGLAAFKPEQISRGWIGYAGVVASMNDSFAQAVLDAADFYGRDAVIEGLINEPEWTLTFRHADSAAQDVLLRAEEEAETLTALGVQLKESSYSLQNERWALRVADRGDQLAELSEPSQVAIAEAETLLALNETLSRPAGSVAPTQRPRRFGQTMERMFAAFHRKEPKLADPVIYDALSLQNLRPIQTSGGAETAMELTVAPRESVVQQAALFTGAGAVATSTTLGASLQDDIAPLTANEEQVETLGAALALGALMTPGVGQDRPELLDRLLNDRAVHACMDWSRTQMEVCVAAGHFKYEDAFCIAQHQLTEIGGCIGGIVGQ